jgi:hypothetical protein
MPPPQPKHKELIEEEQKSDASIHSWGTGWAIVRAEAKKIATVFHPTDHVVVVYIFYTTQHGSNIRCDW